MQRPVVRTLIALMLPPALACGGEEPTAPAVTFEEGACTIDAFELQSGGVPRDAIPALVNPPMVAASHADADYIRPGDRVIGMVVDGEAMAIPHNILWWHEIANFTRGELNFAVTYCPLTGTAVAFDRAGVGGAELGVSGLLFRNNLVMYDRNEAETLWPQIWGEGVCGSRTEDTLTRLPAMEVSWRTWVNLHPRTTVVSKETGFERDYTRYPYGDYEALGSPPFLPQSYDRSRPPKERTLGLEGANGTALAIPFGELDSAPSTVHAVSLDGAPLVVIWDRTARSAVAFSARAIREDGEAAEEVVTLTVVDGALVDEATGSVWNLRGQAVTGPRAGWQLPLHTKAMVVFWFAWGGFHPDSEVYLPRTGAGGSGSSSGS